MLMICLADACYLHFKDIESLEIIRSFRYFYANRGGRNVGKIQLSAHALIGNL